jgi:hypothetical protein
MARKSEQTLVRQRTATEIQLREGPEQSGLHDLDQIPNPEISA